MTHEQKKQKFVQILSAEAAVLYFMHNNFLGTDIL